MGYHAWMLGAALAGRKEFDRAIAEYEIAIELKPKDLEAQLGLAESCLMTDQQEKGGRLVKEILKQAPDNERALLLRDRRKD